MKSAVNADQSRQHMNKRKSTERLPAGQTTLAEGALPVPADQGAQAPKAVFFSFQHPELMPGGAQAIAKGLHAAHLAKHGPQSSLFIAAMVTGGPLRAAGSNIVQLAPQEFVYITPSFDYEYFTNFDEVGQLALMDLLESFHPTILHFHHFMGFGLDFLQACLSRFQATSVFTVHEHLLVCHNDGHLLQKNNMHVCTEVSYAACTTCLPHFRYDYFQHRMVHFGRVIKQFDRVTAVSESSATLVGKALGLETPILVIPNGPIVKEDEFTVDDLSTLRIGFIGQIHPTKGVHLLLDSVIELCEDDEALASRFDIAVWGNFIGSDEYKARIESAISVLAALKVRVSLNGSYTASDLPALLHDRNVVVIPSMWPESYCLTADEALQMGKILVSSEFPAIRERFSASAGILFFPLGSGGGLKMRLAELLARPYPVTVKISSTRKFDSFDQIYGLYADTYESAT